MGDVKKWSEKDIKIKLHNLRKRIPLKKIEEEVGRCKLMTDNLADAMNMAYYNLKWEYSKIDPSKFGRVRYVQYTPKPIYNNIWNIWYNQYMPLSDGTSSSCTIYTSTSSSCTTYTPTSYL